MSEVNNKKTLANAGFLLFMCWLVYSCSYLGKVNFSASKISVMENFNVNEAEVGLVGTFFFFAYGFGMVLNGIFCKRYNIKLVIFSVLIVSSIVNLSITFIPKNAFGVIKFLWLINGAVLSSLWPTLIRLLSETLPKFKMPTASKVMGTTVATGTLVIYGFSALFAELNVYKLSFLLPAIVMPIVAILWLAFYKRFTAVPKEEVVQPLPLEQTTQKKHKVSSQIMTIIVCLAVFAVCTNLIKDGLVGWVPKILKDSYDLPSSLSILLTLALPVIGILANFFTVWLSGKIKNLILLEGIYFSFASLLIFGITFFLKTDSIVVSFAMMIFTYMLSAGSNNIVTSIFPLSMKGKINSGLIAGVLNGFCYVGSTLSDYGLGSIKVATGSWISVFYVLLGCSCLIVSISLVYNLVRLIKKKKW